MEETEKASVKQKGDLTNLSNTPVGRLYEIAQAKVKKGILATLPWWLQPMEIYDVDWRNKGWPGGKIPYSEKGDGPLEFARKIHALLD